MDGQNLTDTPKCDSGGFPKVTVSNEIKLLIESEEPDRILTYILTNMDIMRQQLNIIIPMVSEISRESKKTNGKIIKLQEWKDEYENLLPETIISVNDHEKSIKEHAEKITDMESKVEVHHTTLVKTTTIWGFLTRTIIAVAGTITAAAAIFEIVK